MRRNDRKKTDPKVIQKMVKAAQVLRLGLVDKENPYIVPLNFGVEFNPMVFYFHCASYGRKVDILQRNNSVCFQIDEGRLVTANVPCDWGMEYKSILGYGKILFIEEPNDKIFALNRIMEHYGSKKKGNYPPVQIQKITVLKLVVDSLSCKISK
ncbi:MAG: pyridoxamine 5'-phosphate oxidase family protein [Leptospirales bacterium]